MKQSTAQKTKNKALGLATALVPVIVELGASGQRYAMVGTTLIAVLLVAYYGFADDITKASPAIDEMISDYIESMDEETAKQLGEMSGDVAQELADMSADELQQLREKLE